MLRPVVYLFAFAHASKHSRQHVFSPDSRQVQPSSIYRTSGAVISAQKDLITGLYTLNGPGASITYDFGLMTAGAPTLRYGTTSCTLCNGIGLPGFTCTTGCDGLGVAYSEAARFAGVASDQSILYTHDDGTYYVPVTSNQQYTVPSSHARGSFRYLTLSTPANASADYSIQVALEYINFNAEPSHAIPSVYSSYFSSSDDLLNHVWYAAAYTLQLCTIAANSSVEHVYLLQPQGWSEDATATGMTGLDELLVDGAKRDRYPWSGDFGVSIRSSSVFRGEDLTPIKNSLSAMFALQDATSGYFPYCGSPLGVEFGLLSPLYGSDTYNLWTIASFCEYVLASSDKSYGTQHWSAILRGINAATVQVGTSGLFNGKGTEDWGRIGAGGENTALNAILYYTLNMLSRTASYLGEADQGWSTIAEKVKSAINAQLFDEQAGLFFDNTTSAGHQVYPQDGNVLAVHFNVTNSASRSQTILANLAKRHTKYGAPAPEAPGAISPFITSFELFARLAANPGNVGVVLSIVRQQWGYMLNTFSKSTLIEGYGSDGSLTYPFYPNGSASISHTHAWSTAPLYVLSAHVAGLRASVFDVPVDDGDWVFRPAVYDSDLQFVNAGFARPAGNYSVSWELTDESWEAEIAVPAGTTGTIYVPTFSECASLYLDSVEVLADEGDLAVGFVRMPNVKSGKHMVEVVF